MTRLVDTKSLLSCALTVCETDGFKVLGGQISMFSLMPKSSDVIQCITLFPLSCGSLTVPEITLEYFDEAKEKVQLNLTDNSLTNDMPRQLLVQSSPEVSSLGRIRIFPNSG